MSSEREAPSATSEHGRSFAHASEAELARILDFYEVRWMYEPHTFPILWNLDGAVVESFTPDFFLPELDLYLELTTLKQGLVRKKNRKLRRLRELYPNVRIKLFYARDFRALMLKFGKLALVDALSGTSGQVVPDRGEPSIAAAVTIEPFAPSPDPAVEEPLIAKALVAEPAAVHRPAAAATPPATADDDERRAARRAARRRRRRQSIAAHLASPPPR